jgi:hypothetical protein
MEIEVKLYDNTWMFKKQLNQKQISWDIEFQEELNWGQWNLTLSFEYDLETFNFWDIIEIRNSEVWNLYTWIIENINVYEFEEKSFVQIEFYGIFTALNDIIYKDWSNKIFTKTWTIESIAKSIIDYFNTQYWSLFGDTQILDSELIRYVTWSIVASDTISIEFNNLDCLWALKKLLENTIYSFFIWSDWIIYIKSESTQINKILTFEKEIINIERQVSKKDLVNKLFLKRKDWTELIYEDITSQNTFWVKEKIENRSELENFTTQNFYWNNFIEKNKNPKEIIEINVKNIPVSPWYIIQTLNTLNPINGIQVMKIDIKKDSKKLYLWEFESFGKKIIQR